MRFDLFENKVKEAADNHHPAYDELAWRKMRKLLDQHLPEKEKKRRFLFLLPLILLLGGGAWLAIEYPGKRQTQQAVNQETTKPAESISAEKTLPYPPDEESHTSPNQSEPNPVFEQGNLPAHFLKRSGNNDFIRISGNEPQTGKRPLNTSAGVENEMISQTGNEISLAPPERIIPPGEGSVEGLTPEFLKSSPTPETSKDPSLQASSSSPETAVSEVKEKNAESSPGKKKRSQNRFFFFASLGADASFIKEMGAARLMPGAGAGFTFRDKITIRAGLFAARKVYSAKPSEYDLPPNILAYYPNLRKIDADCDVLELPLLVSYQFGRSAKQQWMGTAGISSIFMKKEKYDYHFRPTPGSPEITKSYTLRNESIHHYSIATLSVGYKRQLSKNVSLTAEPYIKMPLKGVGLGKVKLHSGGVMLTVAVSPFGK